MLRWTSLAAFASRDGRSVSMRFSGSTSHCTWLGRSAAGFALIAGSLGVTAAGLAACGASEDAGAYGGSYTGGSSGSGGGYSTAIGSTGTGQDASLDIGSDREDDGGYDPIAPYAHLCGEGLCTPGASDGGTCGGSGGGGAGGGSELSCKLSPAEPPAEGVAGACVASGTQALTEPCQTSSDCAPGLGCAAGNTCRPYCCGDVELCPSGMYCAPTPMAEDTRTPPALVPMCVTATHCLLLEETSCEPGQTCTIVREDGTTSCVVPGTGQLCEPCDCAPGFVCSKATNQCRKLCSTTAPPGEQCPGGYCQAGSMNYPEGFGVCVGGELDC